jgi:hypothetical protein
MKLLGAAFHQEESCQDFRLAQHDQHDQHGPSWASWAIMTQPVPSWQQVTSQSRSAESVPRVW